MCVATKEYDEVHVSRGADVAEAQARELLRESGASRFRAWLIVPLRVEWEARHHVVDPTSPANSSRDRVSSLALA